MSLQNRVNPFGELLAVADRGTLLGNRGGRFHRDDRTLGRRCYVTRSWICCRLQFNNRKRDVWGNAYTELFFLDEVTALAAGHRPCFECRRKDAEAFAMLWVRAQGRTTRARAAEMDRVLHSERLDGGLKRKHRIAFDDLPDGTMVEIDRVPWAVRGGVVWPWTLAGYQEPHIRPKTEVATVLTPPSILHVLAGGYRPQWHISAERL